MRYILFILLLLNYFSMTAQGVLIPHQESGDTLQAYYASPTPSRGAGIVILHAWMGQQDFERSVADSLASVGYHALAADIYGIHYRPTSTAEARLASSLYKNNPKRYQARIQEAVDLLVQQGVHKDSVAVIGYCFGGTGALETARGQLPVRGVVSFHGGLGKDSTRLNADIHPKVLVLHGADDPFVPKEDIEAFQQEMREGKADWQMIYYANAVHAFTNPLSGNDNARGAAYNRTAAQRSWHHLLLFLSELFQNP